MRRTSILLLSLFLACGDDDTPAPGDAGIDASVSREDAAVAADGGAQDAGAMDGGAEDAGVEQDAFVPVDAGPPTLEEGTTCSEFTGLRCVAGTQCVGDPAAVPGWPENPNDGADTLITDDIGTCEDEAGTGGVRFGAFDASSETFAPNVGRGCETEGSREVAYHLWRITNHGDAEASVVLVEDGRHRQLFVQRFEDFDPARPGEHCRTLLDGSDDGVGSDVAPLSLPAGEHFDLVVVNAADRDAYTWHYFTPDCDDCQVSLDRIR